MKAHNERAAIAQRVFDRDENECVFCGQPPQDAHHILERRLWEKGGGYELDNLVSVCGECHELCEIGDYLPDDCRKAANIRTVLVPDYMYDDVEYDKWGNVLINSYTLSPGPLMDD